MKSENILLDHGSGGKIANNMVADMILPAFDNPVLAKLDDSAVVEVAGSRLSFSTDSYVVEPIFFPGGNIGDLAINGTVNDIAMGGARPLYLSVGLIMEEGFPVEDLQRILSAMGEAARKAGVQVVTGDTKVVPKGKADRIFINTSGFGTVPDGLDVSGANAKPGDLVIVSGTIADHGMTILTQREGMTFDAAIRSDSAPLNHMVQDILAAAPDVHVLRDPTRGGLGTTLNEIAKQSKVSIRMKEELIPVHDAVAGVCELLGFDPLYVANEGKLIAIVPEASAEKALAAIRTSEYGKDACIIGEVFAESPGSVVMETRIGGSRIVDMLTGEQLPRIC